MTNRVSAPSAEALAAIDKVMRAYHIWADPDVLEDLALLLDSHAANAVAVERAKYTALVKLALYCLSDAGWGSGGDWIGGDLDGCSFQDEAKRLGVLVKKPHNAEDAEDDYGCQYDANGDCKGDEDCGLLFLADGLSEAIEANRAAPAVTR